MNSLVEKELHELREEAITSAQAERLVAILRENDGALALYVKLVSFQADLRELTAALHAVSEGSRRA